MNTMEFPEIATPSTRAQYHDRKVESARPLPNAFLNQIAEALKLPPARPVKNANTFSKLLGLKLDGKYRNSLGAMDVYQWLLNRLGHSKIDHCLKLTLQGGDVLLLVQPYHHPTPEDVKLIENQGGYVVSPDSGWGFLHLFCELDVYLVPAAAIANFR